MCVTANISKGVLTRADKGLSVDTQGDVCDKDRASNGSKPGAPTVVDLQ